MWRQLDRQRRLMQFAGLLFAGISYSSEVPHVADRPDFNVATIIYAPI
jgi:hypothetical protein